MANVSDYTLVRLTDTCDLTQPLIVNEPNNNINGHDIVWLLECCTEIFYLSVVYNESLRPEYVKSIASVMLNNARGLIIAARDTEDAIFTNPVVHRNLVSGLSVNSYTASSPFELLTVMPLVDNDLIPDEHASGSALRWREIYDFQKALKDSANMPIWAYRTLTSSIPYDFPYTLNIIYDGDFVSKSLSYYEIYRHDIESMTINDPYVTGVWYTQGLGGETKVSAKQNVAWCQGLSYMPAAVERTAETWATLRVRKSVPKFWSNDTTTTDVTRYMLYKIDNQSKSLKLGLNINYILSDISKNLGITDDLAHPLGTTAGVEKANAGLENEYNKDKVPDPSIPILLSARAEFVVEIVNLFQAFNPFARVNTIT